MFRRNAHGGCSRLTRRLSGRDADHGAGGLRGSGSTAGGDRRVGVGAAARSVDVLAFASTSSGYALGHDEESALVKGLNERWDVPACATSLSAVSALRSRRIERISLVHPPWFGPLAQRARRRLLPNRGLRGRRRSAGRPSRRSGADRAGHGRRVGRAAPLPPRRSSRHRRERLPSRSRHPPARGPPGRLVLEANQVLLWSVLESAQVSVDIDGFGVLFEGSTFPIHLAAGTYDDLG